MLELLTIALADLLTTVGSLDLVVVQQADPGPLECWVDPDRNMARCAVEEYRSPIGNALFGLIIGGIVMLPMYVASDGSLGVTAVITTLLGGALVPMLPGAYQGIALTIMLLGLVGSVFAVGVKYVARGGM